MIFAILALASCGGHPGGEKPGHESSASASKMEAAQYPEKEGLAVKLETLRPEEFRHFIEVNGSVRAEKEVYISSETPGTIKTIHIEEGERVKRGQLLVSLNSSVLESNIREVKTSLKLADANYAKQKELWDEGIGSEMQYLQAKNNKESQEARLKTLYAQLEMTKIKAGFSGIANEIYLKEGELASPGVRILHLVNCGDLKVYGSVSESLFPNVNKGDSVSLTFPVYPAYIMKAKLHRKSVTINEKSRTFKVEIKLNNKEGKIKPNMISRIIINDFSDENALIVPSHILKHDLNGSFLYVAEKQGDQLIANKTYVTPGRSYKGETMILEGLEAGQQIIVVGYNMVSSGAHIYVAS